MTQTNTTNLHSFPVHENWTENNGKLRQIFTNITSYDIMFEESRKDLISTDKAIGISRQVMSGLLSDSIKKCIVLFRAQML